MTKKEQELREGIVVATTCLNTTHSREANLKKYYHYIAEAAKKGARLIVFPEQSLQGYLWFENAGFSEEELTYHYQNAEDIPGPTTEELVKAAGENNIYIIWGMTERGKVGGETAVLYNSAVLVGPEGLIGVYRKVHQPLGERILYQGGNSWPVFDTGIGKIGILICYDMSFPEGARELALQGAEILVMPTAWVDIPEQGDYFPFCFDRYASVRAMENQCFFIASNVCGECGRTTVEFCGRSQIISPSGRVLAGLAKEEGIVFASVNVKKDILKARTVEFLNLNLIHDRVPSSYKHIADESLYYPPTHFR